MLATFLVYGVFRDSIGVEVNEGILAKVFVSDAGVGIPVLNLNRERQTCKLRLDTVMLEIDASKTASIYCPDGTQQESLLPDIEMVMNAGDLRIIVVSR